MKSVCPPLNHGKPVDDVFVCSTCRTPEVCGAEMACAREVESAATQAASKARAEIVSRNRSRNVTVERVGGEWQATQVMRRGRCLGCRAPSGLYCGGCGSFIDDGWNGR